MCDAETPFKVVTIGYESPQWKCPVCRSLLKTSLHGRFVFYASGVIDQTINEGKPDKLQKKVADDELDTFLSAMNALLNEGGGALGVHVSKPQFLGKFDDKIDNKLPKLIADHTFYHDNFERFFVDDKHVVFRVIPRPRPHSTLAFNTKVSLNVGLQDATHQQMQSLMENISAHEKTGKVQQAVSNQQLRTAAGEPTTSKEPETLKQSSAVTPPSAGEPPKSKQPQTAGLEAEQQPTATHHPHIANQPLKRKHCMSTTSDDSNNSEPLSKRRLETPAEQPTTSKEFTEAEPSSELSQSSCSGILRKPTTFIRGEEVVIGTGVFQESLCVQAKSIDRKIDTMSDSGQRMKKLINYCWEKSCNYISAFTKIASGGTIFFGLAEAKNGKGERTGKYVCEGLLLNENEREELKTAILEKVENNMLWLACSRIVEPVKVTFHKVEKGSADLCVVEVEVRKVHGVSFCHAKGPRSYKLVTNSGQSTLKEVKLSKWVQTCFTERKRRLEAAKAELEDDQKKQETRLGNQDDILKGIPQNKIPVFRRK
ncbi:hypothetical protein BaRGS_00023355 [Batillaria attramentaria]|uniref:Schlafen AlbA-2 domain-containing protein n=1 Tax=Batillaria attramentaria TaxID=370345 RepID=A0ABD0KEP7_9CAEN